MKRNSQKLNIVFMGTPQFAVPSLDALISDEEISVSLVVTQEDKKIGRKQEQSIPPVKQIALKNNIEVSQVNKLITIKEKLEELKPDLIIVIAYGKIIPKEILDIPKYGCINIHGSLLPKYRGAACVQAAIRDREKETGVTIMRMDEGLDTGPIIKQFKIEISEQDTSLDMFPKLAKLGADNLVETIKSYVNGDLKEQKQDDKEATYEAMLKSSDGEIDWSKNSLDIKALLRAYTPWPGVYTYFNNKKLKIIEFGKTLEKEGNSLGKFFIQDKSLFINAQDKAIEIIKLQLEGKKPMDSSTFIQGYKTQINN